VHHELGWNYRMTNLQAALGLAQLEQIDQFINRKREMGNLYQNELSFLIDKGYQLPVKNTSYATNIYWVFAMVAPTAVEKERMVKHLSAHQIGTRPFFWNMHEQPVFQKMGLFKNEHYPIAEKLSRNGFYIPSGLGLTNEEILRVAACIR
jgi:perosamine synthetase